MDITGLTQEEVRQRISQGKVNGEERKARNTIFDILFRNLTSPLNLILLVLGAALVICHDIISAVAATGIMLVNVLVSTAQEYRAKRRLEKIALLIRPHAAVIRDGRETEIDRGDIVIDDIIHFRTGDQAQVDGVVIASKQQEADESLLTGESRTVKKKEGDTVSSGSFCVSGECYFKATAVGDDTFSQSMTAAARKFEKKRTPIEKETAAATQFLMGISLFFVLIVVIKNAIAQGQYSIDQIDNTLKQTVIILDQIPVALFLFITITYMIQSVRMGDSGVLLQNPQSVESMSHVDTLCMDKTGTITTNRLVYEDSCCFIPEEEAAALIRRLCGSSSSLNRTMGAVCEEYGKEECELVDEIPFSSARKYSAVRFRKGTTDTVFAGAWSILRPHCSDAGAVDAAVAERSRKGLRTLVFCRAGDVPLHEGDEDVIPPLEPTAVVSIRDEVRPDCREIIGQFHQNGVQIKVISGDDPDTVRALFEQADIPGGRDTVSGDQLDALSGTEYDEAVLRASIFGRMRPEQKEEVIDCLMRNGRYVAMVGDGVNDVRPIKRANVGIAMESGQGAARGVADMVLVNNNFNALPEAVHQGRRTVSGMRDILRFYLTRNVTLLMLVLICLVILGYSPLEPIHNALWAGLSVSIPTLILTFWAKATDEKGNILPKVIRFATPISITTLIFYFAVFGGTYWCLGNGLLDAHGLITGMVDSMDGQFDFLKNMNGYDLTTEPGMIGFITNGKGVDSLNYYVARNLQVLFLICSGITQLLLLFPPAKRLCWERERPREIVPLATFVFVLLLLVAAFVFQPFAMVSIASMVLFDLRTYAVLAGVTVVWYLITTLLLKSKLAETIGDSSEGLASKIANGQQKLATRRKGRRDE